MIKRSLSTAFLCLCVGVTSCTGKSSGVGADPDPGVVLDPIDDRSGTVPDPGGANPGDRRGDRGGDEGNGPGSNGPGSNGPGGEKSLPLEPPGGVPQPVPEPLTMLLFGSGIAGLAYRYRRRNPTVVAADDADAGEV